MMKCWLQSGQKVQRLSKNDGAAHRTFSLLKLLDQKIVGLSMAQAFLDQVASFLASYATNVNNNINSDKQCVSTLHRFHKNCYNIFRLSMTLATTSSHRYRKKKNIYYPHQICLSQFQLLALSQLHF